MKSEIITVGWREWVALPDLNLPAIKAKIDTGAKTSTLHAFQLEPFSVRGRKKIRFSLHPLQKRTDLEMICTADIIDTRVVSDSGGHREKRYVIKTPIQFGNREWSIEITLTNRDSMLFRMLLGRSAMSGHLQVDPSASFTVGKPEKIVRQYKHLLGKRASR